MSLSSPFVHRPVGTTLLTIAITLAGAIGYLLLPVSPLPQIHFRSLRICQVLVPKQWRLRWRHRWNGSSAGLPESRK